MHVRTSEKRSGDYRGVLLLAAILLLACFCALVPPACAQTGSTGGLAVTVTDPSGGVIPGATVTVNNNAGLSRSDKTGASGSITFSLLPPGNYSVTISDTGFKTLQIPSVTVNITETNTLSQALQIGEQQQQVTVTAESEAIQLETSGLGAVVNSSDITNLPLASRNYTQVLSLSAGVVSSVYDGTQLGMGSQDLEANGQNNVSNSFQMDGISVSDLGSNELFDPDGFWGSTPIPSPDAIQEFKVQTSSFDAGFGRNDGANVNVVTKSGTNDWHGTLFEFVRNDDFNANGFFQKEAGVARGKLKQNQFGGVLGGPVKKNKAFVFFSYEGTRQVNGVSAQGFQAADLPVQLTNVRTASVLGAEFCPANNPAGSPGARYATTFLGGASAGFPNNQVNCNGSNINPVALAILNAKGSNGEYFIPSPQVILNPGTSNAVGFSANSVASTFDENQVLFNADYLLTPKHTLSFKYFYSYAPETRGFNTAANNCVPVGCGATVLGGNQTAILKLTSVITNNLVNEARMSYFYIRASVVPLDPFTPQQFGITPAASWLPYSPVLTFSGLFTAGGETVDGEKSPQDSYEWSDQLSWTHGRHVIRMGYDQNHLGGETIFYGPDRGGLTFQTFADFLLGESAAQNGTSQSNIFATSARVTIQGGADNEMRQNLISAFVQDDFKVSHRLTANLGVRWEYDGVVYDALGFDFNAPWNLLNTVPIPPLTGTYVGYTMPSNYPGALPAGVLRRPTKTSVPTMPIDQFAPRIGLAWQPFGTSGRFVVRAGYGWFFDTTTQNPFVVQMDSTPPNANSSSLSGAANGACTLAVPFCALPPLGFPLRTPTTLLSFSSQVVSLKTPTSQAYHLEFQYLLKPSLALELGYVGNRDEHVWSSESFNEPALASPTNPINCGNPVTGCITTNTAGNAAQRVPVLGIAPFGYGQYGNFGDSYYNAVQATVTKTVSHGLHFQAAYTFGRAFTDFSGTELHAGGGSLNSNDPTNRAQLYGPADWNRPQRLVVSYFYRLPDYHGGEGVAGKSLSGWGISGDTTVQSGLPMTLTDAKGGAVYGATFSRAQFCPGMGPNNLETAGSVFSRLNNFFNRAAVADTSASPAGCALPIVGAIGGVGGATGFGNSGRAIALGPGQDNWDISISKITHVGLIRETADLEFRADFFNAFNHPQFSNPGVSVTAATFGVISSTAVGPRIMQFGLKYIF